MIAYKSYGTGEDGAVKQDQVGLGISEGLLKFVQAEWPCFSLNSIEVQTGEETANEGDQGDAHFEGPMD